MNFRRDGHKLTVTFHGDYRFTPTVVCPYSADDPDRPCRWVAHKPDEAPDCWVAHVFEDHGSEILEWTDTEFTPVNLSDGPFEFEWYVDEEEFWWRNVPST